MMVDPSDLVWLGLAILLIPFVFGAVGLLFDRMSTDTTPQGGPHDE